MSIPMSRSLSLAGIAALLSQEPALSPNEALEIVLAFYNDAGAPLTHLVTGNTGMSAGIENALAERVGDIIAFFVHEEVVDNGTGTTFTTTSLRFARVMEVDLHGAPDKKRLVVQPTSYMGPGIIVDDDAPSTHGQLGQVYLVK